MTVAAAGQHPNWNGCQSGGTYQRYQQEVRNLNIPWRISGNTRNVRQIQYVNKYSFVTINTYFQRHQLTTAFDCPASPIPSPRPATTLTTRWSAGPGSTSPTRSRTRRTTGWGTTRGTRSGWRRTTCATRIVRLFSRSCYICFSLVSCKIERTKERTSTIKNKEIHRQIK